MHFSPILGEAQRSRLVRRGGSDMDLKVGTKVRFIERYRPPGVGRFAVGVIVCVEPSSNPWPPRVRVRFDNYLSGWIWPQVLVRV
jgi:hypothetical protein